MPLELAAIMYLVSALTGVCVGVLAWLVFHALAGIRVERRQFRIRVPLLFSLLLPLVHYVVPFLRRPVFEKLLASTDARLVQAGIDQGLRPEEFVGLRVVYVVVFSIAGAVSLSFGMRPLTAFGVILILFGALYPAMWLRGVIRGRHRSIQRALPNVLDLLTLSVEAGRDFLTALRDILRNRRPDPLGEELERVFRETQLGKQRRQALRDMSLRVKQPDLSAVVETLVQADELGVSIGHILRILGDQMRQKRFQRAEKLANEAPVKLMLPLFVFIFPAVLIVIFGPVLLRWRVTEFLR